MKNRDYYLPIALSLMLTLAAAAVCFFTNKIYAVIILISGFAVTVTFYIYTKIRYKRLAQLNSYLERICAGDFDMNISDNSEGELSILKNNLHKVIRMLYTSKERLEKDKTFLADSLADISHQLKTPLTSMTVITDLLKCETDPEKQKEFAGIIEAQCKKMTWLISTLLKLSKLDADTADFNITELDSVNIADEALAPFLIISDLKFIKIKKNVQPFKFLGDKGWCVEAFENIVKNCIEHTPQNGTVVFSARSTSVYYEFTIEDNGSGISKEDLPHIFERFYHGKNSTDESVGIGLALAKTVFEKQKASLTVESEEGSGTKFTVKFYKTVI